MIWKVVKPGRATLTSIRRSGTIFLQVATAPYLSVASLPPLAQGGGRAGGREEPLSILEIKVARLSPLGID